MKIVSTLYTEVHSLRALKRLHKAIIYQRLIHADLHKIYKAMIHLERYLERLVYQESKTKQPSKKG